MTTLDFNKSEFYAEHIKKWQESGMGQKKYCASNDISYPAFVYWRIKFRGKSKKFSPKEKPTFVPISTHLPENSIKPAVAPSLHPAISIVLPNGTQLSLPSTISPASLGDYLKAIKAIL